MRTAQGREWLNGWLHSDAFFEDREVWLACGEQDETCLDAWMKSSGGTVDYVLFSSKDAKDFKRLSLSLKSSPNYENIYQNSEVELFQKIR